MAQPLPRRERIPRPGLIPPRECAALAPFSRGLAPVCAPIKGQSRGFSGHERRPSAARIPHGATLRPTAASASFGAWVRVREPAVGDQRLVSADGYGALSPLFRLVPGPLVRFLRSEGASGVELLRGTTVATVSWRTGGAHRYPPPLRSAGCRVVLLALTVRDDLAAIALPALGGLAHCLCRRRASGDR
jgi:hypothetical protein